MISHLNGAITEGQKDVLSAKQFFSLQVNSVLCTVGLL